MTQPQPCDTQQCAPPQMPAGVGTGSSQPEQGRLMFDSLAVPIHTRVTARDGHGMTVEQTLPFLRLHTRARDESQRRCSLQAVQIAFEQNVPRLVLRLAYEAPLAELPVHRLELEADPAQAEPEPAPSRVARATRPYVPALPPPLPPRVGEEFVTIIDDDEGPPEPVAPRGLWSGLALTAVSGLPERARVACVALLMAMIAECARRWVALACATDTAFGHGRGLWLALTRLGKGLGHLLWLAFVADPPEPGMLNPPRAASSPGSTNERRGARVRISGLGAKRVSRPDSRAQNARRGAAPRHRSHGARARVWARFGRAQLDRAARPAEQRRTRSTQEPRGRSSRPLSPDKNLG